MKPVKTREPKYHGPCTRDSCNADVYTRRLCRRHYNQDQYKATCVCGKSKGVASKLCRSCSFQANRGERSSRWNGGKATSTQGYKMVRSPNHPKAHKSGYVYEHRLVTEAHLGRLLTEDENVHHINGNRTDNRIENLQLWSTSQPAGQRVEDKTAWAIEWLQQYAPEVLK